MMYAKYTVVLRDLLLNEDVKAKIDDALSTYPLYVKKSKEEYIPSYVPTRSELNNKLLNYYKYREIGFETIGRFLDELEIAMNEIMPYYNQLFFSADQDFNIIYNVDYKRENTIKRDGKDNGTETRTNSGLTESTMNNTSNSTASDTSSMTSSNNDASKNVESQTPQSELSITAKNIDSVDYADKVNWNKNEADGTTNSEGSSTSNTTNTGSGSVETSGNETTSKNDTHEQNEEALEVVKGNYGQVSAQRLVLTYRETILNIEQQIINDRRIQELFMMVY